MAVAVGAGSVSVAVAVAVAAGLDESSSPPQPEETTAHAMANTIETSFVDFIQLSFRRMANRPSFPDLTRIQNSFWIEDGLHGFHQVERGT